MTADPGGEDRVNTRYLGLDLLVHERGIDVLDDRRRVVTTFPTMSGVRRWARAERREKRTAA